MLEAVLQQIVARPGVHGVVLSDSEGEPVFACGPTDAERLQLLGAYQGILMSAVSRLLEDENRTAITICDTETILTRHLKDGYFISVILSPGVYFAQAQFDFQELYASLIQEL